MHSDIVKIVSLRVVRSCSPILDLLNLTYPKFCTSPTATSFHHWTTGQPRRVCACLRSTTCVTLQTCIVTGTSKAQTDERNGWTCVHASTGRRRCRANVCGCGKWVDEEVEAIWCGERREGGRHEGYREGRRARRQLL